MIGETAEIDDDVTLYQGVTLGGIAPSVDSRAQINVKRHPTLKAGVIVGSGAQILGPITVGARARVGANSVVTRDVPPGATVVGIPAHVVASRDQGACERFSAYGTPAGGCPDPVLASIEALRGQLSALVDRMDAMQGELDRLRAARRAPVNGSGESESTSDAARNPRRPGSPPASGPITEPPRRTEETSVKLSTKGRYAVMAMADLAHHSNGRPVALAEVADRQEISLSYLEQLFGRLRRGGLVSSVRGPGGGYMLVANRSKCASPTSSSPSMSRSRRPAVRPARPTAATRTGAAV